MLQTRSRQLGSVTRKKLGAYNQKRDFVVTSEPRGTVGKPRARALSFVVQEHHARNLHYDFRLELNGTLKSWAVPKGVSQVLGERRLAIHVENHPLEYGKFSGTIPKGQYGAGAVIIWDKGTWIPEGDAGKAYKKGHLSFSLEGNRLRGRWTLIRMRGWEARGKENWLLIKASDDEAVAPSPSSPVEQKHRAKEKAKQPNSKVKSAGSANGNGNGQRSPLPIPEWVAPQLASQQDNLPAADDWSFETKYDGYRILARLEQHRVALFSRNGKDWTKRFGDIAKALEALPVENAWLDGEVVVFDERGISDFGALQRSFDKCERAVPAYVAFDLMFINGIDLRNRPLDERRKALAYLFQKKTSGLLKMSAVLDGDAHALLHVACKNGLEGLIAKHRGASYEGRRSSTWQKLKCRPLDEAVIGGFTEPQGSRRGFGALLIGTYENGHLLYRGRVGTGFDAGLLQQIHSKLKAQEQKACPFEETPGYHPAKASIHWVAPKLVAEIAYAGITKDGLFRQASFVGLRDDKYPKEVHMPTLLVPPSPYTPVPIPRFKRAIKPALRDSIGVAGVAISHAERVFSETDSLTKGDLAHYYESVWPSLAPHISGRPLTLVRCTGGNLSACFHQRHMNVLQVGGNRQRMDPGKKWVYISSLNQLILMVQLGALEFHSWGAITPSLDRPDRLILDLDPDPALPWSEVRTGCDLIRTLLNTLSLRWFIKTSGGNGIHFVVPLDVRHTWTEVHNFAHRMATHMAKVAPALFTDKMSKSERKGRIYLDYLRNQESATTVAPFSARARAGLPVSVPIDWKELSMDIRGSHFNIRNVLERLKRQRVDPWVEFFKVRQRITNEMKKTLG